MAIGLIGKKIGMTKEFFNSGISVPVTVLFIEKGRILEVITKDKRGYDAIKVGFGKIKNSKLTKQMKGVYLKKATVEKKFLREKKLNKIKKKIYFYTIKDKKLFNQFRDKNLIFENL